MRANLVISTALDMDATIVDANTGVKLRKTGEPCSECGTDFIFSETDMDDFVDEVNSISQHFSTKSWAVGFVSGILAGGCAAYVVWG